jgi:two-component system, OmpR family, sensor kinase
MMSIRLRFTLLYTAVLALMLAVFGIALYSIQSRTTWNTLKSDLVRTGEGLEQFVHMVVGAPYPYGMGVAGATWPKSFMFFSYDTIYTQLPEWELIRILDAQGDLLASPYGRIEDALPIPPEGLAALQSDREWWETITVKGQPVLLYMRPVVSGGEVVSILQVGHPLAERDQSLRNLAVILITASLITLVAAFGIGWVFSGYAFRPIQRLTQTAKTIGEERDFSRRVEHAGPADEVGQLAATFNSMLTRLQEAYQQVACMLEEQRNFVVDVSHELRTPLTTLRGNLDLLRREPPVPPADQADILGDMVEESDRLIRLVNELLMLARADVRRDLARETISLRPVLEETCRQARSLDPQRTVRLDSSESALMGDRDALKQIFLIVLDNAVKYSTGDIAVTAAENGGKVDISVMDHGDGIPVEQLRHIFDRFYRCMNSNSIPGLGLGLSIAKSLVERQGGSIRMESTVGSGSIVTISFPVAPPAD